VISVEEIIPGFYTLTFKRQFDFVPGQVVALGINTSHDPCLYSIASGNQKEYMRILFDVKTNGFLTPQLIQLKPRDLIYVSEPFGEFTPSDKNEWWIATGTGIAPFISMVESGIKLPDKLLQGARILNQFLFQDLFIKKLKDKYLRFCTREQGEGVILGRLTEWLNTQNDLLQNIKYYLCGNPDMVVDVRDIILDNGVDFENIMAEIYF
jgi:ferredoxin-NADP reductase